MHFLGKKLPSIFILFEKEPNMYKTYNYDQALKLEMFFMFLTKLNIHQGSTIWYRKMLAGHQSYEFRGFE